jgi:sodium/bile acid cotransporter 7
MIAVFINDFMDPTVGGVQRNTEKPPYLLPDGKPMTPHLLCCQGIGIPPRRDCLTLDALHLRYPRLLQHWGPFSAHAQEVVTADERKKQKVYKLYRDYADSFPEVKDISAREAMTLMKTKRVVFVDVRKPEEQEVSMLPGAVTDEIFKRNVKRYKDQIVIGYCTISYRSGKLAKKLRKKGFAMLNLKGGLLAWVHEGGKVYDEQGETKRVHVYWKKWNYLPAGYEAVW